MADKPFKLTEKQLEFRQLASSDATFILAVGGSRSGKTAVICNILETRALAVPNSRIGIFRATATAIRSTVFDNTYRQMSRLRNPNLLSQCKINETEMTIEYPNGSVVMFFGLEENKMDRILGQEFSTIYVNEATPTEFPSFAPIGTLITRLSQKLDGPNGQPLRKKFFMDCNPSTSAHWCYKLFEEKVQPETGEPLPNPENYAVLGMNPADNQANLDPDYITNLKATLTAKQQRRFISGEWLTEVDGALFLAENIDAKRLPTNGQPYLKKTIVAVDPSTTSGGDHTGIVVVGIDEFGHGYVLEDLTTKGSPEKWAKRVNDSYDRWNADYVLAEANQGGEMVTSVLRQFNKQLPVKLVSAIKNKQDRATPIALLYEQHKVSHVGYFKELEDQMTSFTDDYNRKKQGSPDRLDALVWGLTELMLKSQAKPAETTVVTAGRFGNYS